jgi:hypothetical protein
MARLQWGKEGGNGPGQGICSDPSPCPAKEIKGLRGIFFFIMWAVHKQFQDLILYITLCTCCKNFISLISVHSHPPFPYTVFHYNTSSMNPSTHISYERMYWNSIPLLHSISAFSLINETSQFSLKQTAKVLWSLTIKCTSAFKGYFNIFQFIIFSGPNRSRQHSIHEKSSSMTNLVNYHDFRLDSDKTTVHFNLSNIACIFLYKSFAILQFP